MPDNEDLLDADLAALLIGEDDPMIEPPMEIAIKVTYLDGESINIDLRVSGMYRDEAIAVLTEAIDMLEEDAKNE